MGIAKSGGNGRSTRQPLLRQIDGEWVFNHGKHRGETLEATAENYPKYVHWVWSDVLEDLPKAAADEVEEVMKRYNI
jgi:hypothetical protein